MEEFSLEERRKRNIERNQSFLRDLLAGNDQTSQSSTVGDNNVTGTSAMFSPRKGKKREQNSEDICTAIELFPCREMQIRTLSQTICNFLKKVRTNSFKLSWTFINISNITDGVIF